MPHHPQTRADRRNAVARAKAAALRKMKQGNWFRFMPELITPKRIGKAESVHFRPCSCWMCAGDPYEKTRFDVRAADQLRVGIGELYSP